MDVRVLGPMLVTRQGENVPLGGRQQRLLLALLVIDANRTVSTSALIDGLWDEPPASARKTVQVYIHHLRAALGDIIETEQSGYRLRLEPDSIDSNRFTAMLDETRRGAEPGSAGRRLAEALALWAGSPYQDLDGALALEPEIARLNELRMSALEDRIEADLKMGRVTALVGELDALTREYPLREHLRRLHMLALYHSGRQSEALRAFERTRRYLAEELGIEPSVELRLLEDQILTDAVEPLPAEPADPDTLLSVRGYEIRAEVGGGPLGRIHRAYQTSMSREVALKSLASDLADDPEFIERFEDEARRLGSLEHPHIVPLHDSWREPGAAYQVMSWMRGGNLADRTFTQAQAVQVLEQIGAALAYAHRHGVDHCRLKPSNVLFDDDGNAYISDFAILGTGWRHDGGDDTVYLAPEVRLSRTAHLPGSDIWSLGALAHLLFTGSAPRLTNTGVEISADVGDPLGSLLATSLLPDPEDRFERVEDFTRALRQAAGLDVTAAAATDPPAPRSDIANPYKGLRAFQEQDAVHFFGRDDLIDRLVVLAGSGSLLAVVGPSGIGKSSVVKAGLVPRLRAARGPSDPPLLVAEMFPGTYPFEELAATLLRVAVDRPTDLVGELMADDRGLLRVSKQILPDDGHLLLVIDQFEELFTMAVDGHSRAAFLDSLVAVASDDRSRVTIVITLRADFYDRPLQHGGFGSLLEHATVPVTVPSEDDLRQVIAGPARAVGLDLEPGLVQEIVTDVVDQPGALPLLQYSLTEMVNRRTTDTLTVDLYRSIGGVVGALGARAEELYSGLSAAGHEAIRQAFLRLVTVDENADDMRRRVRRSELAALPVTQSELTRAITLFGAHRLLSFDRDPITRGPTIEVAHEALLREWRRLRSWIEHERENLAMQRRLVTALAEWEASGREDSYLLRGSRLAQFETWTQSSGIRITSREASYLEAGRASQTAELDQERRTARRLRRILRAVSILAVVAAVAGGLALVQADHAADQAAAAAASRYESETSRLALQAPQLVDTNRRLALLLAVEAYRRDSGAVGLGALQNVLSALPNFLGYRVGGEGAFAVDLTVDGRVAAATPRGAEVVDLSSGSTASIELAGIVTEVAASPVEPVAAFAGAGFVTLLDLETGRVSPPLEIGAPITALAFGPDGVQLAVGDESGGLTVVDAATGATLLRLPGAHPEDSADGLNAVPHQPRLALIGIRTISFSDDGTRVATGGLDRVRVWETSNGTAIAEWALATRLPSGTRAPAAVRAVSFAPGSRTQLVAVSASALTTLEIGATDPIAEITIPDQSVATTGFATSSNVAITDAAAFVATPAGRLVVIDRTAGTLTSIDTQLTGDPAVAAQGRTVVVAGTEGISMWATDGAGLILSLGSPTTATDVSLLSDPPLAVAAGVAFAEVKVYDLARLDEPVELELPGALPASYAYATDAGILTWHSSGAVPRYRLHSVGDIAPRSVDLGEGSVYSYAVSPEVDLLAIGGGPPADEPAVTVWNLTTGQMVARLVDFVPGAQPQRLVWSLSFSPDGRRLIASTTDGAAVLWETAGWTTVRVLSQGGGQIVMAAYRPSGASVVTVSADGTMRLRDPETFEQQGDPLLGLTGALSGNALGFGFTADGNYLVTTADGVVRLWDLEGRTEIGSGFASASGTTPGVTADASFAATYLDGRVQFWNLDFDAWADIACLAAGRNLTLDEWSQLGPRNEDYRPTCDMWPSAGEEPA